MVLLDLPVNNPTKVENPEHLEPLVIETSCGPVQEHEKDVIISGQTIPFSSLNDLTLKLYC